MNLFLLSLIYLFPSQSRELHLVETTREKVIIEWSLQDESTERLFTFLALPLGSNPSYRLIEADSVGVGAPTGEEAPLVDFGTPMIMRDFGLLPVYVNPFRRRNGERVLLKEGKVEIYLGSGPYLVSRRRSPSLAFYPIYRSLMANFDEISPSIDQYKRGSYLIITHEDFYDAALELAQWKTKEGWKTVVVPLSEIGQNPTKEDIRDFVQNAYETWDLPPDFLLLFGDVDIPSGGGIPAFNYGLDATDRPYGLMEGDDYLPEIFVGRFAVDLPTEADFAVQKTISYESVPYIEETNWYKRALLVAGVYMQTEIVNTTRLTKLWVREKMLSMGYSPDTVIGYQTGGGGTTSDVINSIDSGVVFVNYRGWSHSLGWVWPQFYSTHVMNQLSNGWKMPVMFSITCGTGNFAASNDPSFGEAWIRAWDVVSDKPRGGPAVFAPTNPDVHTRWNNGVDVGLMTGLLDEGVEVLGPLTVRGLSELFRGFPGRDAPGDSIEFYFMVYNLQGDPSLKVWTDVPHDLSVSHPQSIPLGPYALQISVADQSGEDLPEDAYVQVTKGEEVYVGKVLPPLGLVNFSFETSSTGTLEIAVTGRNLKPYLAHIPVEAEDHHLGLIGYTVSDEGGDGKLNPGESIDLFLSIKNTGSEVESLVTLYLTEVREGKSIDTVSVVGTIPAGETGDSQDPLTFLVDSTVEDSALISLSMLISSKSGSYPAYLEIEAVAPKLVLDSVSWDDPSGNGELDPGETADLYLTFKNEGRKAFDQGTVRLVPLMNGIHIESEEVSFPAIPSGGSSTNSEPWVLSLEEDFTPGRKVPFELTLLGGKSKIHMTILLGLGEVGVNVPTGPDEYGYWAYDTRDTASGNAPVFDWVEIDPNEGGSGTLLTTGDDGLHTFRLPFTFTFYSQQLDTVTVSTNGWLCFARTDQFSPRNWPIPSPFGPPNLVAAFWDELDASETGVYGLYDEENKRYIVEWSRVRNKYEDSLETFQVILFDPVYHPTPTGDGEILFQYLTVNNVDEKHYYSTVGIEDFDHSVGLGYVYGLFYPSSAETLRNELAILFSTEPPDTYITSKKEDTWVLGNLGRAVVFPNPFKDQVTLALPLTHEGNLSISLYDRAGRTLYKRIKGPFKKGFQRIELKDLGALSLRSGIYFLLIEASSRRWLFKILKASE